MFTIALALAGYLQRLKPSVVTVYYVFRAVKHATNVYSRADLGMTAVYSSAMNTLISAHALTAVYSNYSFLINEYLPLRRFLPNAPQFGERATFSRQKASQSKDCGALQDGALWRHQSAAHTVGEKWRTCRHVLKCCCDTLVFFFTRPYLLFFGGRGDV